MGLFDFLRKTSASNIRQVQSTKMNDFVMTPASDELKASLLTNAELWRKIAREKLNVELNYDLEGVRWIDGYLERLHQNASPEQRKGAFQVVGAFLGECIIRNIGGDWCRLDEDVVVRFDSRNCAFPFSKVWKHLENGAESGDSVLGFYETNETMETNRRNGVKVIENWP